MKRESNRKIAGFIEAFLSQNNGNLDALRLWVNR
jgi:hypothetical protein